MSKGVAVVQKLGLRRSQASLYKLLVDKLETGESVTVTEAKDIWLTQVHSDMVNGVPYKWNYSVAVRDENDVFKGWTSERVKMTHEEILERSLMWLTSTIGILVIRGYLKVIPMIDVKQLTKRNIKK